MTRFIMLDTETTGLDPKFGDRIVEIGCVEMIDRTITGSTYHTYLNPMRSVPEQAFKVHGLSDEFLSSKPIFSNIANEFIEYIKDSVLIVHNSKFDVKFLSYELNKINMRGIEEYVSDVIDSLSVAKNKYPGQRNNLDALCDRLEVDRQGRDYHGALLDCQILAQVWLKMTDGDDLIDKCPVALFTPQNIIDSNILLEVMDLDLNKHNSMVEMINA